MDRVANGWGGLREILSKAEKELGLHLARGEFVLRGIDASAAPSGHAAVEKMGTPKRKAPTRDCRWCDQEDYAPWRGICELSIPRHEALRKIAPGLPFTRL